ncbi:hypothetical protein FF011L_04460 [Roseimaritima multifibrata]|uniref:Uncharacterized protein n=1 Tax=Roseimaritima multifibrata TaxID=1930274 RepID=A0A517M9Z7_9BACT|nr:DUF58 domain-containing protein [Roseimaritima multifibrata]QDS91713.1 hypothetical protein FF011L_04460 [Roseimaritima multifibrata]
MAMAHESPSSAGWLSRVLTTDFCPWANRFVYWLKEPIGWFVLATAISVVIGLFLNPIGWTLAASLTAIIGVGITWPLVAIHVTACELKPEVTWVPEDDACRMILSVRNRIPIPVWGLAVEGYLDCESDEAMPTVGLACVPPLCVSEFGITVTPSLRGHYPVQMPRVSCSFPFGIWTAKRKLTATKSLTVWPKVFPITGTCPIAGGTNSLHGEGSRGGRSGDFVGVRPYRQGDAAKHINWVASARVDSLIVTERGGPQNVELDLWVDTFCQGTRDQLADRIRVAASLLVNLHQANVPMRVMIGSRRLRLAQGTKGRRQILDALADVPADGTDVPPKRDTVPQHAAIEFSSDHGGDTIVRLINPQGGRQARGRLLTKRIHRGETFANQLRDFWTEVRDANVAA